MPFFGILHYVLTLLSDLWAATRLRMAPKSCGKVPPKRAFYPVNYSILRLHNILARQFTRLRMTPVLRVTRLRMTPRLAFLFFRDPSTRSRMAPKSCARFGVILRRVALLERLRMTPRLAQDARAILRRVAGVAKNGNFRVILGPKKPFLGAKMGVRIRPPN